MSGADSQAYDLYELGRLMGAECVLYDQYLNRRPPPTDGFKHTHFTPVVPELPWRERDRDRPISGPYYPPTSRPYDDNRFDFHSKRPGSFYLPENKVIDDGFPRPGSAHHHVSTSSSLGHRYTTPGSLVVETGSYRPTSASSDLPYYDPRREGAFTTAYKHFLLNSID